MFEIDMMEMFIHDHIYGRDLKFSIYPYGKNGKRFEYVLKKAFGLYPSHIVDNYIAELDSSIISEEELIKLCDDDEVLVITVEDRKQEKQLVDNLRDYISSDRILSLAEYNENYVNTFRWVINNRVQLHNIIGDSVGNEYNRIEKKKAINVRILHSRKQTFNTIKTICDAFRKDTHFDVKFIIGFDMDEECIDQVSGYGFDYIKWTEYDVKLDLPDILILYQPYDYMTTLPNINDYVKLVVVVNTLLIRNATDTNAFWKVQNDSYLRFKPDYYLCDSLLYQEIIHDQDRIPYKIVEMGNAKYDGIFSACKEKRFPEKWNKIKNMKRILWTTDHGFHHNKVIDTTFDLYAKTVFEYANNHKDVGFIIRPHPDVKKELIRLGYWSIHDYEKLLEYCENSENIVFDSNPTYDEAYASTNAILTDACCGISISALPTGKPICLAYRSLCDDSYYPDISDAYYEAKTEKDIIAFLDLIVSGKDKKKEKRREISTKCVKHFDGNNGLRIKNFIEEKFRERV